MRPDQLRRILRFLLISSAVLAASFAWRWAVDPDPLFPDVFGFWTFGRIADGPAPASLYDTAHVYAYQQALGMPEMEGGYPYPYPPWFLLALAPLGWMSYPVAAAAWRGVTFALYAVALRAWRWPRLLAGLVVLAPASLLSFVVGQNGFLTGALMLGGVRLLPARPFMAGALLGAVAYKPQFAVLIPAFLLFGWHGRALAGAVAMVVILSLASGAAFGTDVWVAWFASMWEQGAALAAGRPAQLDHMATVTSAVLLLGGNRILAHTAQAVAALGGLMAIWLTRHRRDPAAQAVLPFATMVATPYAFGYDLTITTGAALGALAASIPPGLTSAQTVLLILSIEAPVLTWLELGAGTAVIPVLHILTLAALVQPLTATMPASANHKKSSGVRP